VILIKLFLVEKGCEIRIKNKSQYEYDGIFVQNPPSPSPQGGGLLFASLLYFLYNGVI